MFDTRVHPRFAITILGFAALVVLWLAQPWAGDVARVAAQGGETNVALAASPVSALAPAPDARPAAARTIRYTYDTAGRLTGADYGDKRIAYTYDNAGNLTQRQASGGVAPFYLPLILR